MAMAFGLLYDDQGVIRQRMTGGARVFAATAAALGLRYLTVMDDHAYEADHHVADGKLVPNADG